MAQLKVPWPTAYVRYALSLTAPRTPHGPRNAGMLDIFDTCKVQSARQSRVPSAVHRAVGRITYALES